MYSSYWTPKDGRESTVLTDHEALSRDEATHRSIQTDETQLRPLDLETIMSSKAAVKYWYLHRPKTMRFVHETAVKIQSVGRAFAVRQLIRKYGIEYTVELAKTDAKKKHREWLAELSERERMEAERHHQEYEARVQETKRIRREQAEAARLLEEERIAQDTRKEAERRMIEERRMTEKTMMTQEKSVKEEYLAEEGVETTVTVERRVTMEKVTIVQESYEEHIYRLSDTEAHAKEALAIETDEESLSTDGMDSVDHQAIGKIEDEGAAMDQEYEEALRLQADEREMMQQEEDEQHRLQYLLKEEEERLLQQTEISLMAHEEEELRTFLDQEWQLRFDEQKQLTAEDEVERARLNLLKLEKLENYDQSYSLDVPVLVHGYGPGRVIKYDKDTDMYDVHLAEPSLKDVLTVPSSVIELDDERILSPRTRVNTPFGFGEVIGLDPHVGCYAVHAESEAIIEEDQVLAFVQIRDVIVPAPERETVIVDEKLPIPEEIGIVSVRIIDSRVITQKGKKFIQYKLEINTNNYGTVYCWKRYSTFRNLCDRLHKEAGVKKKNIPQIPHRQIIGNFSQKTIGERAEKLNRFLNAAVKADHLQWGIRVDDNLAVYKRRVKKRRNTSRQE
uniref:Myosinlike protein putative n=1 Tax=Albugo laibachii Nc14 TaxID=890382 RepID=F0WTE1_9STRA|nr:myosinlike protein putative [Albugo laibachii Nc14]|eukprot:CCA24631.1 myosinlike protein putative [Albugo laibachii Nc14]